MNEFHECIINKHGDWTINGKRHLLPVKVILDYIKTTNKTATKVSLNDIGWKGLHTKDTDGLTERYHKCDTTFPGVIVEGGENPYSKKYRMIDGSHRIRKIIRETNQTHSDFFVLSNEEFLGLLKKHESQRWNDDEYIELVEQKDIFGFPACIYRFKKHDEYKESIIDYLGSDEMLSKYFTGGGYVRSDGMQKPFLSSDKKVVMALRKAFETATKHFYEDILMANLSCNQNPDKRQSYKTKMNPKITQSWVVRVPPNPEGDTSKPMTTHAHFLSPVCGSYYLKLSRDKKTQGGNLVFVNPGLNIHEPSSNTNILHSFLKCKGIKWDTIQPVNEGEIILWAGALRHTIEPTAYMKDERISVIINTCPDPLASNRSNYVYNITNYYEESHK